MIKVYVAGPYTKGDIAMNIKNALRVADYLISAHGVHPKVPHLTHFWHMMFPQKYEFWLAYDLVELAECDALVRLGGESNGADKEMQYAVDVLGIPVCFFKSFSFESLSLLDEFIHNLKKKNDT